MLLISEDGLIMAVRNLRRPSINGIYLLLISNKSTKKINSKSLKKYFMQT